MKLLRISLLLAFLLPLTSCSDDDVYLSSAPEMLSIHMAVTNNAGDDLVFPYDDSSSMGDDIGNYKFETWNAYLGKKLVQSDQEDVMVRFKPTLYNRKMSQYFISLETDTKLQSQMKDWCKKHQAKYVLTSQSLFGDSKEHVIDLEIVGMEDKVKQTFFIKFSIFVDGIKQEVYYPESWEGLYPKDPHSYVDRPYFVLNVDTL